MKSLQPYWFLQSPIDAEHKYYVLMDFLQSVERDLGQKKYSEQIQKINRIYNDIKNFQKTNRLSDKTLRSMTQDEIDRTNELTLLNKDDQEVEYIIEGSLEVLDGFINKINPYLEEIEKSIKFKIHNDGIFSKDRGFVVMRNNKDKKMKIYSWVFSIIKVDEIDQVGLLLSELLDPIPVYTKSDKKIFDFFSKEISMFSKNENCFIVADLEKTKGEEEISFDIIKDKSIEFIVNNYRDYLSML
jgi:hypothetical protein